MKDSIRRRLERLAERYQEVGRLLSDPDLPGRSERFRELSMEYARLEPLAHGYRGFAALEAEAHAAAELAAVRELPKDPHDDGIIFLEIRAGAGGDEAAIFAGDLFRMYSRYADAQRWKVEVLSESRGEHGGFREIICRIVGRGAYSRLKFESGTHRVQRVPATEAQGRIHTSTCTVAILPELAEVEDVPVADADLRIDTYRSSGAGGQHVNKTDSAVRITHLPTGIVVECQDERSQHKNRSRAMALLKARLLQAERDRQISAQAASRRLQVGSGDRSERIRTYNFPQGRLTDHRIELTLYKLEDIVNGDLDEILTALAREFEAEQLAELE